MDELIPGLRSDRENDDLEFDDSEFAPPELLGDEIPEEEGNEVDDDDEADTRGASARGTRGNDSEPEREVALVIASPTEIQPAWYQALVKHGAPIIPQIIRDFRNDNEVLLDVAEALEHLDFPIPDREAAILNKARQDFDRAARLERRANASLARAETQPVRRSARRRMPSAPGDREVDSSPAGSPRRRQPPPAQIVVTSTSYAAVVAQSGTPRGAAVSRTPATSAPPVGSPAVTSVPVTAVVSRIGPAVTMSYARNPAVVSTAWSAPLPAPPPFMVPQMLRPTFVSSAPVSQALVNQSFGPFVPYQALTFMPPTPVSAGNPTAAPPPPPPVGDPSLVVGSRVSRQGQGRNRDVYAAIRAVNESRPLAEEPAEPDPPAPAKMYESARRKLLAPQYFAPPPEIGHYSFAALYDPSLEDGVGLSRDPTRPNLVEVSRQYLKERRDMLKGMTYYLWQLWNQGTVQINNLEDIANHVVAMPEYVNKPKWSEVLDPSLFPKEVTTFLDELDYWDHLIMCLLKLLAPKFRSMCPQRSPLYDEARADFLYIRDTDFLMETSSSEDS